MKNRIAHFLFTLLLFFYQSNNANAQKVEREYYPNYRVKYEWQVNGNGVKNGYFKSFATDGVLYEKGFYTNGKKSGTWTTYGIMQGYPGEISATMEYNEDKMNGRYIQYCWQNGKRYVCGDYTYRDDQEVTALQYHENGNLQYRRNRDTGVFEEFFLDGSPKEETKNGRRYNYKKSNELGKYVSYLTFDSSNFTFFLDFEKGYLEVVDVYVKSEKCKKCGDYEKGYDFRNLGEPKLRVGKDSREASLDSATYRMIYEHYIKFPNPNKKNKTCPYNFETGDITAYDYNGNYRVFHPDPNGNMRFTKKYYNTNVIYEETDEKGIITIYNDGIISERKAPDNSWTQEYSETGTIKEEKTNDFRKEYHENGKLKLQAGYVNGRNKMPVFEEYYPSGRLRFARGINPEDSTKVGTSAFEYADNDNNQKNALLLFHEYTEGQSGLSPRLVITNQVEIQNHLLNEYRWSIKLYDKKINEILYANGTYPKGELAYKKASKLFYQKMAIINYASEFQLIEDAFKVAQHLTMNAKKIKEPDSEESKKILKKSKDQTEILRLLHIPLQ